MISKKRKSGNVIHAIAAIVALVFGATFYHFIENWNWIDSIYFSSITLTTIGYGDLTPITNIGKIFTIFYVFIGIGIIFSFINHLIKN